MFKHKILTSALVTALVGASVFSAVTFTGCNCSGSQATQQSIATAPQSATTAPLVTEPHAGKTFETDDVLVCNSWIGMMAGQVGMTDYVDTLDGSKKIEIKGNLFGVPVTGKATIVQSGDVINAIDFSTDQLSYEDAKASMTEKYGEPLTEEGESCTFRTGSNTATLTNGESGITLSIR